MPVTLHRAAAYWSTIGPFDSEVIGTVDSEPVYHAGLPVDEYEARFREAGLEVTEFIPEDRDCAGHSVLLAVHRAGA